MRLDVNVNYIINIGGKLDADIKTESIFLAFLKIYFRQDALCIEKVISLLSYLSVNYSGIYTAESNNGELIGIIG